MGGLEKTLFANASSFCNETLHHHNVCLESAGLLARSGSSLTFHSLFLVVVFDVDFNGIRVSHWRRRRRRRLLNWLISSLRTCAGRDESNWCSCLPFQSHHGVFSVSCARFVLVDHSIHAIGLVGLASLCSGDCLGGDVIDIRAGRLLAWCRKMTSQFQGDHTCIDLPHSSSPSAFP